jgi:valine dehydrogenase (NAD+)
MAYKNACAGLDLGGGKAVIIGEPAQHKSEALLRAYGRAVQSLGGRYFTAGDVGTYVEDMDVVAQECEYTTGRSPAAGGSGDSGVLTAFGVFEAMRAAAQHVWGEASLAGRRVGVMGAGKVGARLAGHLVADGAAVVIADVSADAVGRVPSVEVVAPDQLPSLELDVYSPNALGGALTAGVVADLRARLVCGGANNQLASPDIAAVLAERGVTYVPDFIANAGGVIQVGAEALGYSADQAERRTAAIFDTTASVLAEAAASGLLPEQVAEHRAEKRMATAAR